ncbi:MAG: M20/M25/M40 family metallo-hydrolase [Anaerolineales bacterium]|nr:MAG: M20/M25/M40 family metallo-hydrolase [Anaerolineales bacterium]
MISSLIEQVIELSLAVQQIPAPTFSEARRAAFVHQGFYSQGLLDVSMDDTGNVYGRLKGEGLGLPLVISAHLDTVFPIDEDLSITREGDRISGPGIGDNSLGVAGLFGLLWALRHKKASLQRDIWLVANVGEEGLGDLCGMRAVVDRFGDEAYAYIILEGMALGQVYHRGLGVKRYRLLVETQGGHSWVDYGQPSAVHELGKLITQLAQLVLPEKPRTTLNAGVISGGTTVNTIAAQAYLELDLRSESLEALAQLDKQVEARVQAANQPGVRITGTVIGERPVGELASDHTLVRAAVASLESQGLTARLNIGSTDANIPLSRGLPAVCIGLTNGGGAHTSGEFIQIQPLSQGLKQLVALVESLCE